MFALIILLVFFPLCPLDFQLVFLKHEIYCISRNFIGFLFLNKINFNLFDIKYASKIMTSMRQQENPNK